MSPGCSHLVMVELCVADITSVTPTAAPPTCGGSSGGTPCGGWMLPLGLQGGRELCRQPGYDVQSRFGHLAPVVLRGECGQDSKSEEQLSHQCYSLMLY